MNVNKCKAGNDVFVLAGNIRERKQMITLTDPEDLNLEF